MTIVQGTIAAEERLRWLGEQLGADGLVTIADGRRRARRQRDDHPPRPRRARGAGHRPAGAGRRQGRRPADVRRAPRHAPLGPSPASRPSSPSCVPAIGRGRVRRVVDDHAPRRRARTRPATSPSSPTDPTRSPPCRAWPASPRSSPAVSSTRRTGSLVGPARVPRRGAARRSQTFFASAAAIDAARGALEATLDEAEVKRCIAAGAGEVVLARRLVEARRRAPSPLGLEWEQIDLLVTELDPADERLAPYRDLTRAGVA